eukprot:scaffold3801_cov75-Attheya_sp.AAC.3
MRCCCRGSCFLSSSASFSLSVALLEEKSEDGGSVYFLLDLCYYSIKEKSSSEDASRESRRKGMEKQAETMAWEWELDRADQEQEGWRHM